MRTFEYIVYKTTEKSNNLVPDLLDEKFDRYLGIKNTSTMLWDGFLVTTIESKDQMRIIDFIHQHPRLQYHTMCDGVGEYKQWIKLFNQKLGL